MNLKELDSFKMADAVTFHDELNPKLWHNGHLRPEVRDQLVLIAEDFLSELGIPDVDVDDITVSGSNAAFSYTPHSDLDLHLLVDMSRFDDDIYKEFFNAKKSLYNEAHHITIHGIPVEVYVQDSREPVVSLGEYSVLHNKWLRIPTKRRANFDQTTTQSKYNTLKDLIELALKSKDLKKVEKITRKIKQYRQAGLDKGGEFGPENLAYKALRSQGYITKLYDLRDKLHSEILTIETMYQNPLEMVEEEEKSELPAKVYHVTPASNLGSIMKAGLRPQVGTRSSQIPGEQSAIYCFPDKTSLEDAMMNWLGDEFDEDEELALLEIDTSNLTGEYTPNAEFEIAITSLIPPNRIKVLSSNLVTINESDVSITPVEKTLPVTPYGIKEKQFRGSIAETFDQPYSLKWEKSDYGDVDALAKLPDGSPLSIMFNKQENDDGEEAVQVEFYRNNSQEVTSEGDAMRVFATVLTAIQQYVKEYKPARLTFSASKDNWAKQKQNSESRSKLYDRLVQRYSAGWGYKAFRADKGDLVTYELSRLKSPVAEASGYIPSEKEKNDPRFKTALTVDVKPDAVKKNAKSFYWKTSRAGIPPTANTNGKF